MLEVEDHHVSTSDASDTMNFWNNLVYIYNKLSLVGSHRSRHSCCACRSGVRWKGFFPAPEMTYIVSGRALNSIHSLNGFFCVRPAYCWSQKQNDQVIANASLFETEQKSINEHRHQCLCVKFGIVTLMEMDCKYVSTKDVIQYYVVWLILCCVLLLNTI